MPLSRAKGESRDVQSCIASPRTKAHVAPMVGKSPLDDPHKAAHAWARYRRLMRFMLLVTVGTVSIAMALLYKFNGMVSVHFYIALALGMGFMMLLTSALMGLVFLSNGTGHDAAVDNTLPRHTEE